jgi:hypothetical protein
MTPAELEAERLALLAEEQALLDAHERLHDTPDDRSGHHQHRERLKAHQERVRAFKDALHRTVLWPPTDAQRMPEACPVCQSVSFVPSDRPDVYRCLTCGTKWTAEPPE